MGRYKSNNLIDDLFVDCASVNECTGLYQKVSLSTEEIAKFHKEYTEDK